MPRFDGTGPMGYGQGSGRQMGPCCKGYGFGNKIGMRGGLRSRVTKDEEKEILDKDIVYLEEELKAAKDRLSEISESE